MYKAGDFTNGKMNEIFKQAHANDVSISHKQLGEFRLSSVESDFDCLMTVLECKYGIFLDTSSDKKVFRSLLSTDELGININTSLEAHANSFSAEDLATGLLLLSEVRSGGVLNGSDPTRSLMWIALTKDCHIPINHISNADSKKLISSVVTKNNSLSKEKCAGFLADPSQRLFNAVRMVIMDMVIDSIQYNIIDTDCQPEHDWNCFKYCLVHFGVCDILGKVTQEHIDICVQHLINEGVINEIIHPEFGACDNEFTINVTSKEA